MSWNTSKLSALTNYLKRGISPKYVDKDGIWVINQKCIRDNSISLEFLKHTSIGQNLIKEKFIQRGDSLVNSTGTGTLGRTAYVKEVSSPSTVDSHVTIVRPNPYMVHPRFLGFQLALKERYIESMGRGATNQVELSISDLGELEITLPPLPTQCRIAAILSAYDDLIENNLKRIRLLEEAAQHIYREWFVHFRFPGHERVRRGADGLPEGWRRVPFSQAVQINPSTSTVKDVPAPYVPMASVSESMMIITDVEERIPSGGARFKNGDTLFARITPCLENGKTAFVQFLDGEQTATGSTEFIVFRETKRVNRFFIYCLSRDYSFRQNAIKSMTGSDGRQRVKPEAFDSYLIAIPPTVVMDQFFIVAAPLFKQVQVLVNSNDRLKEARDILLPRLMNRTIEV